MLDKANNKCFKETEDVYHKYQMVIGYSHGTVRTLLLLLLHMSIHCLLCAHVQFGLNLISIVLLLLQ